MSSRPEPPDFIKGRKSPPTHPGKNKPIKEAYLYDLFTMNNNQIIERRLNTFTREDLFIGIPATITNVDDYEKTQCVNVRLIYDLEDEDWDINYAITIRKVMVKLQHGGGFCQKFPVAVGDRCILKWAHKSLDRYLESSGNEQLTLRAFESIAEIRDCWVELGFDTRINNQKPSQTDYILEGENTLNVITPAGEYTLDTKGNITITAGSDVTINCNKATVNAPQSEFTGDVDVKGTLTVEGVSTFKAGALAPTYGGYGGAGSMSIGTVNASVNVTINGKPVKGHDHDGKVPPF